MKKQHRQSLSTDIILRFVKKNLENPVIILYSHKTAFNVVTSRFLAFIAIIVHFCSSCKVYQWSFIDRHKFQCIKLNNLRILIWQEVFAMNEKPGSYIRIIQADVVQMSLQWGYMFFSQVNNWKCWNNFRTMIYQSIKMC